MTDLDLTTDRTPFPGPNHTRHFSNILLKFSERRYLEEFRAGYVLWIVSRPWIGSFSQATSGIFG
jgi:hypothetical protein